MKKNGLLTLLIIALLSYKSSYAQVSVNLNIGRQPDWGPVGYKHVDYYYLPDMDAYYYVPKRQFIYLNGDRWVFVNNPPPQYRDIDLYRTYKVVINEPRPWFHHNVYQEKYRQYKGNYGRQQNLKGNRGNAYGHYKKNGHDNGNHYGNYKKGNNSYNGNHGNYGYGNKQHEKKYNRGNPNNRRNGHSGHGKH